MNALDNLIFQRSLLQAMYVGIDTKKDNLKYGAYINIGSCFIYKLFNSILEASNALSKSLVKGIKTTDGLPITVLYNHLNDCSVFMEQDIKNSYLFDRDVYQSIMDCLDSRMQYKPDSVGYLVTVQSNTKARGSDTIVLSTHDFATEELLCHELTNIGIKLTENKLSETVYYVLRLNNDHNTTVVLFQS